MTVYSQFFKRPIDIGLTLLAMPIWLPVAVVVALLIWGRSGRPILFMQERAGLHGRAFRIVKFCTMRDLRDSEGALLPDHDRVTALGKWLRATSLDELPEFLNVLAGHMSLVGPRPLPVRYLPRYSREQARRHDVRPGITGLAQVNGRNLLDWGAKFDLDVQYVKSVSLRADLVILFRTILVVVTRRGETPNGSLTADEFRSTGSSSDL